MTNSSYRDLIPYGPPSHFMNKKNSPEPIHKDDNHSTSNHYQQVKEKKIALVEFKIEQLLLANNNGGDEIEEKIKYYSEKYDAVRKVLLDHFDEKGFVKVVDEEQSIEKLQKMKVALIENKSCNVL